MFSENPLTSIALVLAILAYVGAVRLAIRQQLSTLKVKLKEETDRDKFRTILDRAKKRSNAITWLMVADILFIGIGIMLMISHFLPSRVIAIDVAFTVGTAYLVYLHGSQWVLAYKPSTTPWKLSDTQKAFEPPSAFCTRLKYIASVVIPLVWAVGLIIWSTSDKHPVPKAAEDHYKLGSELYEQRCFEEAIVQHQHAIQICDCNARYHYALAKALASRNAKTSPLKALQKAIKLDGEGKLAAEAKNEPAFKSIRSDAPIHELVGGPSADRNK